MSFKQDSPAIRVKNLSFRFKKEEHDVLKNISFDIPVGSYVLILGTNGSGKTTMARILSGLYGNFRGLIEFFGTPFTPKNREEIMNRIGFVFQNPENQFLSQTTEEELYFGLEIQNRKPLEMMKKINEIVDLFNLKSILYSNPSELSAGEKQKIAIASIMLTDPDILFLDEPTNLLTEKESIEIFNLITDINKKNKQTIFEISHNVERILVANYVIALHKGELVFAGKPKNFFQKISPEDWKKKFDLELPFVLRASIELKKAGIFSELFWDEKRLIKELCRLKK